MQFVFLGMTDMCPCQVKKVSRTLEVIGGDTSRAAIQKDLAFISYVKHFAVPVLVNNPAKTTGSQETKNATKRKVVDDSTSIADSTTPKTPRRDSMQGVRTPAYYEDGTIRTPRGYDDDEEEIDSNDREEPSSSLQEELRRPRFGFLAQQGSSDAHNATTSRNAQENMAKNGDVSNSKDAARQGDRRPNPPQNSGEKKISKGTARVPPSRSRQDALLEENPLPPSVPKRRMSPGPHTPSYQDDGSRTPGGRTPGYGSRSPGPGCGGRSPGPIPTPSAYGARSPGPGGCTPGYSSSFNSFNPERTLDPGTVPKFGARHCPASPDYHGPRNGGGATPGNRTPQHCGDGGGQGTRFGSQAEPDANANFSRRPQSDFGHRQNGNRTPTNSTSSHAQGYAPVRSSSQIYNDGTPRSPRYVDDEDEQIDRQRNERAAAAPHPPVNSTKATGEVAGNPIFGSNPAAPPPPVLPYQWMYGPIPPPPFPPPPFAPGFAPPMGIPPFGYPPFGAVPVPGQQPAQPFFGASQQQVPPQPPPPPPPEEMSSGSAARPSTPAASAAKQPQERVGGSKFLDVVPPQSKFYQIMRTPTKLRREAHRCMTTRIERILFFVPVAIVTASILVIIATHVSSPAPVQISQRSQIAIVTVMNSSSNLYKTALDSMKCYAYQNDYKFIMVNNTAYHKICPQRDFFFQRHCIVAHLLAESNYSWILLVDTDIGVVNENRTIEEYIRDDADIIFYDRFFNFEVMAGSYLVKKSEYGIKFLRGWANFESRLPKVFSGSDNGAIHILRWPGFTERAGPNTSSIRFVVSRSSSSLLVGGDCDDSENQPFWNTA
ncbi:hypothetical protein Q1695_007691 [Nippostrongylus brasiliensis]|nr:hypothetical protein Q1695_007691 [Nippostrongylus brasiliensis]